MRVKICGITSESDAVQAAALGAHAIGLNFYSSSPRFLSRTQAQAIVRVVPPFVESVALFVNEALSEISETVRAVGGIRAIQFYGDHATLGNPFPLQLIAAFPVGERRDLLGISRYLDLCSAQGYAPTAVLVDARVAGQHGGTGQLVPWDVLAGFQPGTPLILAGGLHAENVAEAVRVVRPYAVDVASGVEASPGRKDAEKMKRFIACALEAAAKVDI